MLSSASQRGGPMAKKRYPPDELARLRERRRRAAFDALAACDQMRVMMIGLKRLERAADHLCAARYDAGKTFDDELTAEDALRAAAERFMDGRCFQRHEQAGDFRWVMLRVSDGEILDPDDFIDAEDLAED